MKALESILMTINQTAALSEISWIISQTLYWSEGVSPSFITDPLTQSPTDQMVTPNSKPFNYKGNIQITEKHMIM